MITCPVKHKRPTILTVHFSCLSIKLSDISNLSSCPRNLSSSLSILSTHLLTPSHNVFVVCRTCCNFKILLNLVVCSLFSQQYRKLITVHILQYYAGSSKEGLVYNDSFLSVDVMLVLLFKLFTLDGWLKLYKDMILVS